MSRTLQDQFIDDEEEETCPLCVEEFDLDDKNFKPCPCGYQICHFCWNNIKNQMNGLCPACRRPYEDKNVQFQAITPEEMVAYKARQAQRQKRSQAALQKEKQKAEADHLSRKHLAGMRVVQKNLVYVTGLSPSSQEDQLLQTLRGEQFFGQYGKIVKIVVSKAKDPSHPASIGVYVTYERKEDAQSCITAVNNSKNGDRTLRAQFGTTKYCSAYLRGETCTNRQCMFLHEPGEANESYSRADLSALNTGSTQHGGSKPPPPQSQQPVASAAQPMERQGSDQSHPSPANRPALPSTASWASRPLQQPSRNESRSTSGAMESPAPVHATPAPAAAPAQPEPVPQPAQIVASPVTAQAPPKQPRPQKPSSSSLLLELIKDFNVDDFKFTFNNAAVSQADMDIITNYPPLFDVNGGAKRRLRRQREEEQRRIEQEAQSFQQESSVDPEDNPEMSGSLQLGGEPEERQTLGQSATAMRPSGIDSTLDPRFQFGNVSSPLSSDRGLTPQQHQQLLLQTMKSNEQGSYLGNAHQAGTFQQPTNPPGHQRNVSRFSFANDTASASASVKPVANAKLLNQQSSIMPQVGGFGNNQQQQFYTSNVQGPPPGLKTTGTPPVSGGMTFGQGHGFATGGLQYGVNAPGRNANEEMMRNLLRGGGRDGVAANRESFSAITSPLNHYSAAAPSAYTQQQQQQQQSSSMYTTGPQQPGAYANSVFSDGEKSANNSTSGRGKKKSKKHGRQGHGNTSSASSGFDVASADTHMLQTRFQAAAGLGGGPGGAAAGGAGGAGGMYNPSSSIGYMHGGGTGAAAYGDDADFPALPPSRQTSINLPDNITNALGASVGSSRHSTPPVPPGFKAPAAITEMSRTSTPTIPPGFAGKVPSALPTLDDDGTLSRPGSRPVSRAGLKRQASSQHIEPVVPLRPGTPRGPISRPGTPGRVVGGVGGEVKVGALDETPTKPAKSGVVGKSGTTSSSSGEGEKQAESVKQVKAEGASVRPAPAAGEPKQKQPAHENKVPTAKAASAESRRPVASEPPAPKPRPVATTEHQHQVIPPTTTAATTAKPRKSSGPMGVQPSSKGQATVQASDAKAAPVTPSKPEAKKEDKRKHPGKLDITAAVIKRDEGPAVTTKPTAADASTPAKAQRSVSQATSLASKPESPSVASPSVKSAPRTLRVVQTPNADAPPPPSFPTTGLPTPSIPAAGKMPSRQPSVASINPPGTPSSEQVSMSDNISVASTSMSRASSPHPLPGGAASRVGSAPVREKTKSQLKKERQERSKISEDVKGEGNGAVTSIAEEPAQEAILSRKKKSKKEKEVRPPRAAKAGAAAATDTAETTPTASRPPSPLQKPAIAEAVKERPITPAKPSTPTKAPVPSAPVKTPVQTAPPPPMPSPHELSPPPTPTLTAASLFAELKTQSPEIQKCIDSLFRTPTSTQLKPNQPLTPKDLYNPAFWKADFKINLTKDEVDALLKGTIPAINYGGQDGRVWDRGMITQSGSHLRALTEELESRFLDLEQALREMPEDLRFRPSKPQNEIKFPAADLEALKRGFDNFAARGPSVMEQMVQDGSTIRKGAFLVDEASKYINEFVMPPATPPSSAGGTRGGGQQGQQGQQQGQAGGGAVGEEVVAPSLEIAERQLLDARRLAEENEGRLRKLIKRNKKLLGLG
ncbi:transcriptional repressor general negative regulator of transcription subunit 4 [Friedmanniomyces endolithicus]|nr:transcriptional repressor general negative regulator of transcription subunit 4 [Friedmanniomyces endolithicus]